jgi:hypothetical protein
MQLSKHFQLKEFTKSQIAARNGISNNPDAYHIENLKLLCMHVLEPTRAYFNRVVAITSGYRSPQLCQAIGSLLTSQHAKGMAADFEINGISNKEVSDWIYLNLHYDQLILEYWTAEEANSGWIHVSYNSDKNRKEYLQAYKNQNNKTVYKALP